MAYNTYNIVIDQGSTYKFPIDYLDLQGDPIPMPNHKARMQIRRTYKSEDALLTVTSDDGDITIGTTNGQIDITISAEATASLPAKRCVYDLELEDTVTGEVERLSEGMVIVRPEVTRT